jgi:hypothetical protein
MRSAITNGVTAPSIPAPTPSSSCIAMSHQAWSESVKSTARIGSTPKPIKRMGFRPIRSAVRPTTTAIGSMMS